MPCCKTRGPGRGRLHYGNVFGLAGAVLLVIVQLLRVLVAPAIVKRPPPLMPAELLLMVLFVHQNWPRLCTRRRTGWAHCDGCWFPYSRGQQEIEPPPGPAGRTRHPVGGSGQGPGPAAPQATAYSLALH